MSFAVLGGFARRRGILKTTGVDFTTSGLLTYGYYAFRGGEAMQTTAAGRKLTRE